MTRLITIATRKPAAPAPKCLACSLTIPGAQWLCAEPSCEKMGGLCFECYVLHVKTAHDKELH